MLHIVVLIIASNQAEADLLSEVLLDAKLVACVNMLDGVTSLFHWRGKKEKVREVLLQCKTTQRHFSKIVEKVKALHSYDVPEIIALPILDGSQEYLKWIDESVG